MRKERVWMVQTEQQYICIHQVSFAVFTAWLNTLMFVGHWFDYICIHQFYFGFLTVWLNNVMIVGRWFDYT
jgi:hypothetical protein